MMSSKIMWDKNGRGWYIQFIDAGWSSEPAVIDGNEYVESAMTGIPQFDDSGNLIGYLYETIFEDIDDEAH